MYRGPTTELLESNLGVYHAQRESVVHAYTSRYINNREKDICH